MATAVAPYDEWLSNKLQSLGEHVDAEVFVAYIISLLDTDTSSDEKRESLEELLGQIMEADQETVCEEIMAEWEKTHDAAARAAQENVKDMGDRLAEIMVNQQLPTMKERQMTDEEKARKAAILAQYAEVSEGESDEDVQPEGAVAGAASIGAVAAAAAGASAGSKGTAGDALLMFKNTNASAVKQREQEQREKSRQEAEKKKEKDKADREAQRQKQQERKETEKKRTQKGERRR